MKTQETNIVTFADAANQHRKECKKLDRLYIYPSSTSSERKRDGSWELANCNGLLATVRPDGQVVFAD